MWTHPPVLKVFLCFSFIFFVYIKWSEEPVLSGTLWQPFLGDFNDVPQILCPLLLPRPQSHRALPPWFAGIFHQSVRTHLVGLGGLNKHCLWVTSSFTRAGFVFLPWPVVPHAEGWRKWSLRYLAQQSLPCYQSHLAQQCLATLSLSLFGFKLFRSWIICKSWFVKKRC